MALSRRGVERGGGTSEPSRNGRHSRGSPRRRQARQLFHVPSGGVESPAAHRDGMMDDDTAHPNDRTGPTRAERRLAAQYETARAVAESATLAEATPKVLL